MPDGLVLVQAAFGDTQSNTGTAQVSVTIDNFMPYVQSVSMLQGLNAFYGASWPLTPQSATILGNSFASTLANSLNNNNGQGLSLAVQFSEQMDSGTTPTVSFAFTDGSTTTVTGNGGWTPTSNPQVWGINTQAGIIPASYIGPVTIQISGAKDLAGNLINPMPQTIAVRNSNGTPWVNSVTNQPVPQGPDMNFVFQVGFPRSFVQAVTISQGGSPIYQAQWPTTPSSTTTTINGHPVTILANAPTVNTNVPAQIGIDTHFDIHFINPMKTSIQPKVEAHFPPSGGVVALKGNWGTDNQTWTADEPPGFITTLAAGKTISLVISGAEDADSKPMDGDPKTIAYLLPTGKGLTGWIADDPGVSDVYHSFQVAALTPTDTPVPTNTPVATATPILPSLTLPAQQILAIELAATGFHDLISIGADTKGRFYIYGNACVPVLTGTCDNPGPAGRLVYIGLWVVDGITGSVLRHDSIGETGDTGILSVGPVGDVAVWNIYKGPNACSSGDFVLSAFNIGNILSNQSPGSSNFCEFRNDTAKEETINYKNVWFDFSGNVYAYGYDVKRRPVDFKNGITSPSVLNVDSLFASDIYGVNHLLTSDGTLYTLDAGNNTTSAFSTHLPPQSVVQDSMMISPDGRIMILDPAAGVLYQYSLTGQQLAQSTVANGSFRPSVLGLGPNGAILLADPQANMRVIPNAPLPPGFTPFPSPTFTATFTPTKTNTPMPTFTPTETPSPTETNLNGYTSTFTETPTNTDTPSPTNTPVSTPTASNDGFSSWLQANDLAAFKPIAHHQALFFNNLLWVLDPSGNTWSSLDGNSWTKVGSAAFPARTDFGAVVFNGTMWVMGGRAANTSDLNDVWSSMDGVNWTEATTAAPWSGRIGFTCVAFNGQIWVMGGKDVDGNALNDAWTSTDGINWNQVTVQTSFPERSFQQCLVFNGQMWVMGGEDFFENPLNDVWSSPDGVNWTEATANASWSPRFGSVAGVENGEMVVLGGSSNYFTPFVTPVIYNDVYHSPDGINWMASTYNASITPRVFGAAVTANGHLWVFGGISDKLSFDTGLGQSLLSLSDVWYSNTQGAPTFTPTFTPTPDVNANWTQATGNAGFIPRANSGIAVFNNRLWVVGGNNSDIGPLGDIWSSADGVNWNLATDDTPFDEQTNLICTTFQGKLWAFNSGDKLTGNNEAVYNSSDGINWNLVTNSTPFTGPSAVYTLNNKLWLVDNFDDNQVARATLYSSSDGANWQVESSNGQVRLGAAYTAFGGKEWFFGGIFNVETTQFLYDVFNTSDGEVWPEGPVSIANNYHALSSGGNIY